MEACFRHFNARETLLAAQALQRFVCERNGRMVFALGGAMSTAEIGRVLAPMIRLGFVHAISSTAANLEEDIFNLIGNRRYRIAHNWRNLTMDDDLAARENRFNRVTDTYIPEAVMNEVHAGILPLWQNADSEGKRFFPWEYIYQLVDSGFLEGKEEVSRAQSWVLAAHDAGIPIFTPGAEDSTLGNFFCSDVMTGKLSGHGCLKSGTEQFARLTEWYLQQDRDHPVGFFQIGGGIAGDFAMCVVPSIIQDHGAEVRRWQYFCHIGDSTTSYGSYSGCPPNEKVTWHKLDPETESFVINSDATIVAPLIFQYVIECHASEIANREIGTASESNVPPSDIHRVNSEEDPFPEHRKAIP